MPGVIVGHPGHRRVVAFQDALAGAGQPAATVLPYLDLLQRRVDPARALAGADWVRIESPGEHFGVESALLAWGGADPSSWVEETGRLRDPAAWFRGFRRLLADLDAAAPAARWLNPPQDILAMCDKPRAKQLAGRNALPACPRFADYAAFREYVQTQPGQGWFVKLDYGSSASGVLAYRLHPGSGREQALTTLEMPDPQDPDRCYNSRRLQRYQGAAVRPVLDALFRCGAYVEPWLPKARWRDGVYDLRIVVIGGRRRHTVARWSRGPITNLHLGNRRLDPADLDLPAGTWTAVDTLATAVMAAYPHSLYAGLDVLLPRDPGPPRLLEVNAFGDLLPGLLDGGASTYAAEVAALRERA